jgi:hypothetical protein
MHRVLCSLFVLASLATGAARADVTFQYTAVPSSTTVQAGSTVTVSIYLTETITPISNASNSNLQNQSIIALDGGVVAAGFFVNTVGTTSASSITALANNVTSGNANGTNFDTANKFNNVSDTRFSATQASVLQSVQGTSSINAGANFSTNSVTSGSVTNNILLGTLTLTGGSTAGTTTYAVESFANAKNSTLFGSSGVPATGNTVTAGLNSSNWPNGPLDLDSTNNNINGGVPPAYTGSGTTGSSGAFEFQITTTTAVPEPSSMALCGLTAFGMGIGAWRRRKARLAAEAEAVAAEATAVNPCA